MSVYDIEEYPHPSRRGILFATDAQGAYNLGRLQYDELTGFDANASNIFGGTAGGPQIRSIEASPRGDLIAYFFSSSQTAGALYVYDGYQNRKLLMSMPSGYSASSRNPLAFAPRGRLLALSGNNFLIVVDLLTGDTVFSNQLNCNVIAWSPDQSILAVGSTTGMVSIIDTSTWDTITLKQISALKPTTGLVWSPDSARLFASIDTTGESSSGHYNMAAYDVVPGAWKPNSFFTASVSNNVQGICGLALNFDGSELLQFLRGSASYMRIRTSDGVLFSSATMSRAARNISNGNVKQHAEGVISIETVQGGTYPFVWLKNTAQGTIELMGRELYSGVGSSSPKAGPALFYGLREVSNKSGPPVSDANGAPAAGCKVIALSRSDFKAASSVATVDADGRYTLVLGTSAPVLIIFAAPSDNYNSAVVDWVVPK